MSVGSSDLPRSNQSGSNASGSNASGSNASGSNPPRPNLRRTDLSGALAAALADAEALAEEKTKNAERDQVRQAVERVTGDDATVQLGPAIRGMPAEDAVRRPQSDDARANDAVAQSRVPSQSQSLTPAAPAAPSLDAVALRAMRQRQEDLRKQLEDARDETVRAQRQLDQLRNDLKATRARFQRMATQYEELQKRHARQELEMPTRLRKQLMRNFLPALDMLDLVTLSLLADARFPEDMQRGVHMLRSSFDRTLQLSQVVAFDSEGQPFDPVVHEAISEEASAEQSPGTVVRQVGRGYLLEGKLLRSAQVVVAKAVG